MVQLKSHFVHFDWANLLFLYKVQLSLAIIDCSEQTINQLLHTPNAVREPLLT